MKQLISIFCLLLFACSSLADTDECDEAGGWLEAENGEYQKAFSMLKPCEYEKEVSGKTLGALAHLYIMIGVAKTNDLDAEMASKFYELILRASLKGEYDSLRGLASIYESGEPLLNIEPNEHIFFCLLAIADHPDTYSENNIQACLNAER